MRRKIPGIIVLWLVAVWLFAQPLAPQVKAAEASNDKTTEASNDKQEVTLYFFYGDGCPHCAKEHKFLDQLQRQRQNLNVREYEVWQNRKNAKLLSNIGKQLGFRVSGVPVLVVGDNPIVGFYNKQTTGAKIKQAIAEHRAGGCTDVVAPLLPENQDQANNGCDQTCKDREQCIQECKHNRDECIHECGCTEKAATSSAPEAVSLPFFGEVQVKDVSLPVLTLLIAATDGFNPCAMWVLLFLISLLLGMQDRKRMWALGSAFILASGAVYFLFLSAWLNLFLFLGFVFWVRVLIGLVALSSGGWHLYGFFTNRGCHVSGSEKRKAVFSRLRAIVAEQKFWVALGGIVLLAAAVNLVELVCSAGLPAVYTQVLSLADLPAWQYYAYLVFYILVFMLDDMVVFIIAMTTLQVTAVDSKYSRWAGLVGGLIMLALGALLLFKPGWIMFG